MSTDANGVATAPDFSANETAGGYIVVARAAGLATEATFALVNSARTTASVSGPAGTYWLVTSTGHVLTSGTAADHGSVTAKLSVQGGRHRHHPGRPGLLGGDGQGPGLPLRQRRQLRLAGQAAPDSPIVGMAASPDGKGYWLVAADGGIFNYGDAVLLRLARPAPPEEPHRGHRRHRRRQGLLAGGIRRRHLQLRRRRLPRLDGGHPPDQAHRGHRGRRLTARATGWWRPTAASSPSAGATFYGAQPSVVPQPVKALVPTPDGDGYWVVSANGTAAGFGDAGAQGSALAAAGRDGRGRGLLGP